MKKLSIILICAAALAMVSCGGNSSKKSGGKSAETKTTVAASDAVDLGLSVKWAKTNLGAKDASEPGNYYAWGETESKKDFSGETYAFKDGYKFKKYTVEDGEASAGTADKLIVLESGDDAAAALGKGWRMPTRAEAMELFTQCKFSYDKPGVITVTGPNGNSIDFPKATGYYYGTKLQEERYTWLWTASMALQVGTPEGSEDALEWHDRKRADAMRFGHTDCYPVYRENGLPIRPVKD